MGEVTNIQHMITSAVGQYPRGDLVFDVGTVIYGVDKGWPMTVIDTDRNDFLARFGVPRRHCDDGYHAYLALHNHESTVGHYVRVVDSSAKYPYLSFNLGLEHWSGEKDYEENDLVYRKGKIYKSLVGGTDVSNIGNDPSRDNDESNWKLHSLWRSYDIPALPIPALPDWKDTTYSKGYRVIYNNVAYVCKVEIATANGTNPSADINNWKASSESEWDGGNTGSDYIVGEIVTYTNTKYVCIENIAGDAENDTPDTDTTWQLYTDGEWNEYISYKAGDIISHEGTKYVCVADIPGAAGNSSPSDDSDNDNWEEYTEGGWNEYISYKEWNKHISYSPGEIISDGGIKYVCVANIPGDSGNSSPAGDDTHWKEYTQGVWYEGVKYQVGDIVQNNEVTYVSRKNDNNVKPAVYWQLYDNYKGAWSYAVDYFKGDLVTDSDKLYLCLVDKINKAATFNADDGWQENKNFQSSAYNSSTTYTTNQIVLHDSKLYLSLLDDNIGNDPADPYWIRYMSPGASSFDVKVSVGGGVFMSAWVKNGFTADNAYGIGISALNDAKETFQVTVYEKINGEDKVAEGPFTVGLVSGSTKADGSPLFIEAVFEQYSQLVGFEVDDEGAEFSMIAEEPVCWFSGGDPGRAPTDADYQKAWNLLKKAEVDQLFMAGDFDTNHIEYALGTADKKQIRLEVDTIGGTPEAVAGWVDNNMGILQSHLLSVTYGRVSFKDPFYRGSRKTLGMSGFATAAKAYGREKSKTMIDAGIEEVPAGEDFGLLRGAAGIRNETPLSEDDQEVLAESWVNYILNSTRAGIIFWEQFTCYGEESPLAYKRVVDVMNYVYKVHREIMQENQFRGKSDYQIIELLNPPLQRLKTKGVLVPDATGESDFPEPFRIWITTPPNSNKRFIHRSMRVSRAIGPIILETILA